MSRTAAEAPPAAAVPVLWGLIALCGGIELALTLADLGIALPHRLRQTAYEYGGFWPGLLSGAWPENYPLQPWLMFVSYGFLHAGALHLVINMATLWSLGRAVADRVGTRGMTLLYAASQLGGGLGFGLLAPDLSPMVGASGALFGLAGGLLAWAYVDRFTWHQALWPVLQTALLLLATNLILAWAMQGHLAWQTHLGGFLAGWITALIIDPTPRD